MRNEQVDEPVLSLDQSFRDAQAIVTGKVVTIDDPRWNSKDGSDWRAEASTENNSFTAPLVFTQVTVEITDVTAASDKPGVSAGDTLLVDFRLDPSLDVLSADDQEAIDSDGVAARYLSPGDVRVFVLDWLPFPYQDGWGEYRWRGSVLNGLWGINDAQDTVYPAGYYQAQELAHSDVASVESIDGATTEISLQDFRTIVLGSRKEA